MCRGSAPLECPLLISSSDDFHQSNMRDSFYYSKFILKHYFITLFKNIAWYVLKEDLYWPSFMTLKRPSTYLKNKSLTLLTQFFLSPLSLHPSLLLCLPPSLPERTWCWDLLVSDLTFHDHCHVRPFHGHPWYICWLVQCLRIHIHDEQHHRECSEIARNCCSGTSTSHCLTPSGIAWTLLQYLLCNSREPYHYWSVQMMHTGWRGSHLVEYQTKCLILLVLQPEKSQPHSASVVLNPNLWQSSVLDGRYISALRSTPT